MKMTNIFEMLEESLKDFSPSEIKVLKAVSLAQREKNQKRIGLMKFWSGIYCLMVNAEYRRKQTAEKLEMDFHGIEEPIIEWTGRNDPANSITLRIFYPENIKDGD